MQKDTPSNICYMSREDGRFWLTISKSSSERLISEEAIPKCHLSFNVRKASDYSGSVGLIAIKVEGTRKEVERQVASFCSNGHVIDPVELRDNLHAITIANIFVSRFVPHSAGIKNLSQYAGSTCLLR